MTDAVEDAQKAFRDYKSEWSEQRTQIEEDQKFSDPSDPQQWDETLKRQRENDPGGARPCLVFDLINQYVQNVVGQVEQRPPSLHVLPVGGGADQRVAEKLDGFFRHIEYASRAQQHYARVALSQARSGVGYVIVRPEYTNRALNYQEPRIGSEGDPLRVVLDPWSVEVDGNDAERGFLLKPLAQEVFKRRFKSKDLVNFGGDTCKDGDSITIVEMWEKVEKTRNMIVYTNPEDGDEVAIPEDDYWKACERAGAQLEVVRTYRDKQTMVMWSEMSGSQVLSKAEEYPASGIGIVPAYGYVTWRDGRLRYCGLPRRGREAQRAYNYHQSELRAYMAAAPKAPWLVAAAAVLGHEALWDKSAAESRAWLPWNHLDENQSPVPQPSRMPVAVNLQNCIAGSQMAREDLQASLGMYLASIGAPSNETSGVAIDSRKQQGEAATSNFPSHLAAAISQAGKLALDMIPKLIDSKRQLRIIGIDGKPSSVVIDPKQAQPLVESSQAMTINPHVGAYDVRVTVGASFNTQRQQAQEAFAEMIRSNPALTPALAPLWAQTLDVPHADKLAQVLTAVAPPEVRAVLDPDGQKQPSVADLTSQMEQMKAALQEAMQVAQEAQDEISQLQQQVDSKARDEEVKAYEAETKRLVGLKDAISPEQVQQLVVQTIEQMMSNPDPLPGDPAGSALPDEPVEQMQPPESMGEPPMEIPQ